MVTGSIYFMGQYRPAYFEGTSIPEVTGKMLDALQHADNSQWFIDRLAEAHKQIKKENCAAYACDHCNIGVSIAKRSHDPFLDSVTAKFPAYPGLDYSQVCNTH